MGDLSDHFSAAEFRCKGGSHTSHPPVHPELVQVLERLRAIKGGRPLAIVSGIRCSRHNAAVGGASRSQHLYGKAADIPAGYATVAEAERAGAKGIGSRGPWAIHVDVRPSAARWRY